MLSTQAVAERLSISASSVRRLAKRGALPPVKVGGLVRYRHEDVEALIQQSLTDDPERET